MLMFSLPRSCMHAGRPEDPRPHRRDPPPGALPGGRAVLPRRRGRGDGADGQRGGAVVQQGAQGQRGEGGQQQQQQRHRRRRQELGGEQPLGSVVHREGRGEQLCGLCDLLLLLVVWHRLGWTPDVHTYVL